MSASLRFSVLFFTTILLFLFSVNLVNAAVSQQTCSDISGSHYAVGIEQNGSLLCKSLYVGEKQIYRGQGQSCQTLGANFYAVGLESDGKILCRDVTNATPQVTNAPGQSCEDIENEPTRYLMVGIQDSGGILCKEIVSDFSASPSQLRFIQTSDIQGFMLEDLTSVASLSSLNRNSDGMPDENSPADWISFPQHTDNMLDPSPRQTVEVEVAVNTSLPNKSRWGFVKITPNDTNITPIFVTIRQDRNFAFTTTNCQQLFPIAGTGSTPCTINVISARHWSVGRVGSPIFFPNWIDLDGVELKVLNTSRARGFALDIEENTGDGRNFNFQLFQYRTEDTSAAPIAELTIRINQNGVDRNQNGVDRQLGFFGNIPVRLSNTPGSLSSIEVVSNSDWRIETDTGGIPSTHLPFQLTNITPRSGNGNRNITISWGKNVEFRERATHVKLFYAGESSPVDSFLLEQRRASDITPPVISNVRLVDSSEIRFQVDGGVIAVTSEPAYINFDTNERVTRVVGYGDCDFNLIRGTTPAFVGIYDGRNSGFDFDKGRVYRNCKFYAYDAAGNETLQHQDVPDFIVPAIQLIPVSVCAAGSVSWTHDTLTSVQRAICNDPPPGSFPTYCSNNPNSCMATLSAGSNGAETSAQCSLSGTGNIAHESSAVFRCNDGNWEFGRINPTLSPTPSPTPSNLGGGGTRMPDRDTQLE